MPNGHIYEGEFYNQTMTGYGTYKYDNGIKYIGYFNDGVKQGQGSEFYADGDLIYKGSFERDRRNGFGVLYEKKSVKTFEGEFKNGKKKEEDYILDSNTDFYTKENNSSENDKKLFDCKENSLFGKNNQISKLIDFVNKDSSLDLVIIRKEYNKNVVILDSLKGNNMKINI